MVSSGGDGTVKLWDLRTKELKKTFVGHEGEVLGCTLSADRTFVVSAGEDGFTRVWNAKNGNNARRKGY